VIGAPNPAINPPKLTDASSWSVPPPLLAKVTGLLPVEPPLATSNVPPRIVTPRIVTPRIVTPLSVLPDSTSSNPPLPTVAPLAVPDPDVDAADNRPALRAATDHNIDAAATDD
jgi:hypothetical protein